MRQYKWKFDSLTALLVAVGNVGLTLLIICRILTDKYFLFTQFGIMEDNDLTILIGGIVSLIMACYLNIEFFKKKYYARWILGFCQTIALASVIRNIFLGHLYFGFKFHAYLENIFVFIFVSILIYHTLFSKNIRIYYAEKLRRS